MSSWLLCRLIWIPVGTRDHVMFILTNQRSAVTHEISEFLSRVRCVLSRVSHVLSRLRYGSPLFTSTQICWVWVIAWLGAVSIVVCNVWALKHKSSLKYYGGVILFNHWIVACKNVSAMIWWISKRRLKIWFIMQASLVQKSRIKRKLENTMYGHCQNMRYAWTFGKHLGISHSLLLK